MQTNDGQSHADSDYAVGAGGEFCTEASMHDSAPTVKPSLTTNVQQTGKSFVAVIMTVSWFRVKFGTNDELNLASVAVVFTLLAESACHSFTPGAAESSVHLMQKRNSTHAGPSALSFHATGIQ